MTPNNNDNVEGKLNSQLVLNCNVQNFPLFAMEN